MAAPLYRLHDGSQIKKMSAKVLIDIPIWKGNRIIDLNHVAEISSKIADVKRLDYGYRIINVEEENTSGKFVTQKYLIDGQHRAHILREHFRTTLCEPDFDVIVLENNVNSETEAIEFFNQINNVKAQQWKTEPALLIQPYIKEFEKRFPKMVRPGNTCRPYLSVDKIREILLKFTHRLPQTDKKVAEFGEQLVQINRKMLEDAPLSITMDKKNGKYYERAASIKFMLAVDPGLSWLAKLVG